ncbi:MAG TPA: hypothetical protein VF524_06490, partial [Polyangia bacterium]
QDLIDCRQRTDMKVFDAPAFYPLGPTMAVHYFRRTTNVAGVARKVVTDATYVVHWYNDDLRKQPRPEDAHALSTLADSQLFAYIAKRFTQASQP